MEQFKRVLLGVEVLPGGVGVSRGTRAAVRQARWLAETVDASVTVFHSRHERQGEAAPADAAVEAIVSDLAVSGVRTRLVYGADKPWLEIIRMVLRGETDLVVVGRRNRRISGGLTIGGVPRRLMRKCPAPVWVVEPGDDGEPSRVLAATDLSEVGDAVVRLAAAVARRSGSSLHVVHAWQVPFELQIEDGRVDEAEHRERLRGLERDAREAIDRSLEGADLPEQVRVHVDCGQPSHTILETVERLEPDLVVMGTISRAGIAGLLVGNTAERLLDQLDCSLLTVKPDDFVSPVKLED